MLDITAQETLLTLVRDVVSDELDRTYSDEGEADENAIAQAVLDKLPEVEWEFTTNENDVPVRRLAIKGEWMVDLTVAEANAQTAGGRK